MSGPLFPQQIHIGTTAPKTLGTLADIFYMLPYNSDEPRISIVLYFEAYYT